MSVMTLNPVFTGFSGKLGNLVFYKRLGKQCVRIHVIPRNPDTEAQRKTRASLSGAVETWQALTNEEKHFWNARGRINGRRGYNLFLSEYMNGKIQTVVDLPVQACKAEESLSGVLLPVFSCTAIVPLRYSRSSPPLVPACSRYSDGLQQFVCLREIKGLGSIRSGIR